MTALAVAVVLCFTVWRLEQVAIRVFDRQHSLAERRIAIDERRYTVKASESELPKDIEQLVMLESEEWARNDLRKMARELYAETESWKAVTQKLSGVLMQRAPDDRVIVS